jgi:hypothetical protein
MSAEGEWPELGPKMREMIVRLYEQQQPEQKLKTVKKGVSSILLAPPPGSAYSGRIDILRDYLAFNTGLIS